MRPGRASALVALGAGLLAAVAYAHAIRGGFVYDDAYLIGANPAVRSLGAALASFGRSYWGHMKGVAPYYRPLPVVSYALDHAVTGLDPSAYHTTNVILHAACAALVGLLVLRLGAMGGTAAPAPLAAGAAFAGALAAVHPVHSEAAAAVYCRPDLLAALFALAFVNLAVRGRTAAALAALALALFSKESAAALPLLAPAALALGARAGREAVEPGGPPPGRRRGRFVLHAALALAILAGYLALRHHALGGWHDPKAITTLDNPLVRAPEAERLLTPVAVAARYASLWVWPAVLCVDRGYDTVPPAASIGDPHVLGGAALLTGGAIALAGLAARRSPWALPLAAAGLAYLPASNLVLLVPALMGERFIYLPSLFVCVLAGGAYARLAGGGRAAAGGPAGWPFGTAGLHAVAAVLILAGGARTFLRCRDYADELALYRSAAESCPRSAKAHYNLGNALARAKRDAEAIEELEACVAIAPWLAIAHNNMGSSYLNLYRLDEAEAAFRRALDLEPTLVKTRANLATVLLLKGRLEAALEEARAALALGPDPDDAAYLGELVRRIEKRSARP